MKCNPPLAASVCSNSAGGGINNFGTLNLSSSTLSGNTASGGTGNQGGGINNFGLVNVTNSTLSGNSARGGFRGWGGGISNNNDGTLNVTNSTLSGNFANSSSINNYGGGIFINNGTVTLTNSTIAGNFINSNANYNFGGGVTGIFTARNTLIAGNTVSGGLSLNQGPDVFGTLNSQGYNLIGNNADATINNQLASDQVGTPGSPLNPQLAPLAHYGGPTETLRPLPGSPAINAGGTATLDEIQKVLVSTGAFTLTFNGRTTAQLDTSDTAATVQDALNALASIGGVNGTTIVAQLDSDHSYSVHFGGTLAGTNLPPLTGTRSDSGTLAISTLLDGGLLATDQRGFARQVGTRVDIGAVETDYTLCSAPVVSITGPPSGSIYAVGAPVTFSGTFTDASAGATHTATWMFDSLTQPGTVNETAVSVTRSFTQAGVYQVSLTVANNCDLSGTANTVGADQFTALVVIYDPSAGWVTGGGWINSPAGALVANPTLTGKANFGFVSKYQRGNSVPTGNTEFQFKAGNLNFKSTAYEWMVIAGARAQYRGAGTINHAGDYRFMLTAIDGQVNGGGGQDKFRIRIWDNAGGGLVYDNQLNAPDSADPTTVLGGGQIVIHSGNGNGNGPLVLNGGAQAKTALAQSSDFDGDGKSDLWSYQATDGRWAIQASSDGVLRYAQLGSLNEVAVPADYDGDGKTDVAVFNATTQRWLIWQSSAGTIRKERFGMTDSQAYPADYDGDGRADLAVRNAQSEWQILRSLDGEVLSFALGAAEDTAVIGDFDGDGLTDAAVYRVAAQAALIRRSSNGETQAVHLPYAAGLPLAGDFDGDGQAELAFWSAEKATLRFKRSSDQQEQKLTINGRALLFGDYDGDGRNDCLSWQSGWQLHLSSRQWKQP